MTFEEQLFAIWGPLVDGRCYPGELPDNPTFPAISYSQVGGNAGWYVDNTLPDHKHARIQVSVFGKVHSQVKQIARGAESALAASGLVAQPYGALQDIPYNELHAIYGTRQAFGIWYLDPPT